MTDGPITFTGLIKFLQYIKGPDSWHNVGATGEPAFANSWVNYDLGGFQDARFLKTAAGVVFLEGVVKNGSMTDGIFTLPQGYRPAANMIFVCMSNSAVGRFDVLTTGVIVPQVGNNAWFSIQCSFYVG